jgi:ABC-2 type transport system ATP-binding protein
MIVSMLSLNSISKRFGSVHAVRGLSLEVPMGCVFGFLGPNGAGKTTSISLMVGLIAPDQGSITIAGKGPPTQPEIRRHLGLATQSLALYDELSAEENLDFFGRLYGLERAKRRSRVDELLGLTGLTERRTGSIAGFSGGMKRRLNLAAALMHDPELVLLDEPTAGVDPQSRSAILDIVRTLRDRGRTIVYTTHYMDEAQRVSDLVGIVDHGTLLALGSVDHLIAAHGGQTVVSVHSARGEERITTGDPVTELAARLAQPDVLNVRVDRPDLEAVFLNLTGRRLRD